MPRPKGLAKTGGRQKGSKNKLDLELKTRIAEKYPNYCPVEAMCLIAIDPETELKYKLLASKEVAQYVYPKLKSIEHSNKDGEAFVVQVVRFGNHNTPQMAT